MKKTAIFFLLSILLIACRSKKDTPDVSGIKSDIKITRFDQDFFSIDTNSIAAGLQQLQQKHPGFYKDFMQEILGVDGQDTSQQTLLVTKEFLRGYLPIYDSLQRNYSKISWLENDLENAFKYVKYYFPEYGNDKVISFLGPFDAPGVASTNSGIAIGLQQYAGTNFSVYNSIEGQELFPLYISRRFSPEYITANCMKAVAQDLFPDISSGKTLIEQMIERGKQWYLIDKFLPTTDDSAKTGYTARQLNWCNENEGLIWSYIIKNEDLHSLSPAVIQTYIGEGPFTQGFSQELSPGNIGQWLGWQIIKKYESKFPGLHPGEIMRTDPKIILDKAKYKPK